MNPLITRDGVIPDTIDDRDLHLQCETHQDHSILPSQVDLFSNDASLNPYLANSTEENHMLIPPVLSQGNLNSCTAHAVASAYWFEFARMNPWVADENPFDPSRLWIWYYAKFLDLTEKKIDTADAVLDLGSSIRNSLKGIHRYGVCQESDFPYSSWGVPTPRKEPLPPLEDKVFAKSHNIVYSRPKTKEIGCVKDSLNQGWPVIFSFYIGQRKAGKVSNAPFDVAHTQGLEKAKKLEEENELAKAKGIAPKKLEPIQVGKPFQNKDAADKFLHAALAYGYDDSRQSVKVRNSFGEDFDYWLPYEYLEVSPDYWTIRYTPVDPNV